jgi:hypothetical protein
MPTSLVAELNEVGEPRLASDPPAERLALRVQIGEQRMEQLDGRKLPRIIIRSHALSHRFLLNTRFSAERRAGRTLGCLVEYLNPVTEPICAHEAVGLSVLLLLIFNSGDKPEHYRF